MLNWYACIKILIFVSHPEKATKPIILFPYVVVFTSGWMGNNMSPVIFYCFETIWSNTNILPRLVSACNPSRTPLLEHSTSPLVSGAGLVITCLCLISLGKCGTWTLTLYSLTIQSPLYAHVPYSFRSLWIYSCCVFCRDCFSSCLSSP